MLSLAPSITKFLYGTSNFFTAFVEVYCDGNLYLGPLHIIDRIFESVIILQSQCLYDQQVDSII